MGVWVLAAGASSVVETVSPLNSVVRKFQVGSSVLMNYSMKCCMLWLARKMHSTMLAVLTRAVDCATL